MDLLLELERRKGNEAFKASEFDAAIRHYTNSIALDCSSDAIWSNRAIAYIKQKLYDLAEVDCTIALSLNGKNVKALARRGFAGLSQGKYKEVPNFVHNGLLFCFPRHPLFFSSLCDINAYQIFFFLLELSTRLRKTTSLHCLPIPRMPNTQNSCKRLWRSTKRRKVNR